MRLVARVVALDPGYRESAVLVFDDNRVVEHCIAPNEQVLTDLPRLRDEAMSVLVIEEMQMFVGHGIGKEVLDSVFWSGRFAQEWQPGRFERLLRAKVRGHLGASKGGDAAVRQALIERFGPYKEDAIGRKAKPGPLFGITSHEWSALAIAVTWSDQHPPERAAG